MTVTESPTPEPTRDACRPEPSRLGAERLTLGYDDTAILTDLSVRIPDGQVTAIVGANACGKSTLLRGLARLMRPRAGAAYLDGHAVHRTPTREVARVLGLLPQSPIAPDGVTVADLVARGRHPHLSAFRRWGEADERAVAHALEVTGTSGLAHRDVVTLSGGQRQRVWVAMALAQETDLLLLDEPTTYLDLAHQIELLDLLREHNRSRGTTVVMVLHELNLACRYADHLLALREGSVVAEGAPDQVLDEELVASVFGLRARVVQDPVTGGPLVVPIGRVRDREEQS